MAKGNILVGLSGGVDSAVSAYLLKKQGYDVHAVFMKNFSEKVAGNYQCPWKEDRLAAYQVAAHLDIPIETWDFQKEYSEHVVEYLFTEYQAGRTPNPDVMCNKRIKFGVFLDRAKKEGFKDVATGHYARVKRTADGKAHLLKGKDTNKDQSYFLAGITQRQLRHAHFPIGNLVKTDVRDIARREKFPNAERAESQGICFIGEVDMKTFLGQRIKQKMGDIIDTEGNKVGEHGGVFFYTIGQRKGLNIGGGPARYVVGKDVQKNLVIVGTDDQLELFSNECSITSFNWLAGERELPLRAKAKIRYRQEDQDVTIEKVGRALRARFARPQRAISPGQTLAVYKGQELVGSGVIA